MSLHPRHPLRHPLRVLLLLALAIGLVVTPAGAQSDPKAKREQVQRERAAVAADIDTLRATDAQVEAALRTLNGNVEARTSELRDAERRSAAAEAALVAATQRVAAKQAEIAELDRAVKDAAVAAFMQPSASAGIIDALSADSIGEAELKQALLEARSANQFDVLDQLQRAREDLEAAQAAAEEADVAARSQQVAVAEQLDAVTQARSQQQAVVADVQDRLDRRLAEADSLAQLDAELAAQIQADQRRIAAELARQRAAEEAAAAAAERAATARRSTPAAPAPAAPSTPSAPSAPSGGRTIAITGSGSIVSVRGIRVHQSIASSVAGLLSAADAAGISLAGGGYRDPAGQIAVRRSNCGTSNYAVYEMPASSCRPPTARPGSSMHERGLAIDFTHNGRIINSRSSPAFRWLAANASSYGLYNLPSEPWHWSVNGN